MGSRDRKITDPPDEEMAEHQACPLI